MSAITLPLLMLWKYGCIHLFPHVIWHLMKYRSLIFKKMVNHAVEAELDFAEKQAVLFIAS